MLAQNPTYTPAVQKGVRNCNTMYDVSCKRRMRPTRDNFLRSISDRAQCAYKSKTKNILTMNDLQMKLQQPKEIGGCWEKFMMSKYQGSFYRKKTIRGKTIM